MPYTVGDRTVYRIGERRDIVPVKTLRDNDFQDYTKLQDECRRLGKPFEDPEFNPNDPKYDLIGNVDLVLMKNDFPRWDGKFYWKRPREMAPQGVTINFSEKNTPDEATFSKSDINQGGLGDCWYLSSLSLIIQQKDLMEFLIPEDNNTDIELGIYHFRFWHKGYFIDVVIDDRIPYWDQSGFGFLTPAFCTINNNEIWPNLLEKAYAKLHRTYFGIEGGWVSYGLEDFTGGVSEMIMLPPQANLFDSLVENHELGNFMGFNTISDDKLERNYGLVKGHAYAFLDAATVQHKGKEQKLVKLRNPWGNAMEWIGEWSDSSPLWNQVSKEDRERLLVNKTDGEFWMPFEIATDTNFFSMIDLCHWYNDLKHNTDMADLPVEYQKFEGKWFGETAAGSASVDAIAKNPQYLIRLKKMTPKEHLNGMCLLIVSLMHKGYVEIKHDLPGFGYKIYQVKQGVPPAVPFPVADFKNGNLTNIGFNTFSYENPERKAQYFREVNILLALPEGYYIIVPCTQNANVPGEFLLRTLSEGNFTKAIGESTKYTIKLGPQGVVTTDGDGKEIVKPEPVPPTPEPGPGPTPNPKEDEKPIPPAPEPAVETEAEKVFKKVAGEDKLVDVKELRTVLNEAFNTLPNFKGFSEETTRALLAVSDYNADGKLDYYECCDLYLKVLNWTKLFADQDLSKRGLLNYFEFSRVLMYGLGYSADLSVITVQSIYQRYAKLKGIAVDQFMLAVAKLQVAKRIFEDNKLDNARNVTMSRDNWFNLSTSF